MTNRVADKGEHEDFNTLFREVQAGHKPIDVLLEDATFRKSLREAIAALDRVGMPTSQAELADWVLSIISGIDKRTAQEETLRDLRGRLITAQEEERNRVARELHHDLNQRMALLSVELEQLSRRVPASQSNLRSSIHDVWERAQEISSEIDRVSYQLHPSKFDHLGLIHDGKVLGKAMRVRDSLLPHSVFDYTRELELEFDDLLAKMQSTKSKRAVQKAFEASSSQLGRAAVKQARKNR